MTLGCLVHHIDDQYCVGCTGKDPIVALLGLFGGVPSALRRDSAAACDMRRPVVPHGIQEPGHTAPVPLLGHPPFYFGRGRGSHPENLIKGGVSDEGGGGGVAWDGRRGCRCFETPQRLNWVFMVVVVV